MMYLSLWTLLVWWRIIASEWGSGWLWLPSWLGPWWGGSFMIANKNKVAQLKIAAQMASQNHFWMAIHPGQCLQPPIRNMGSISNCKCILPIGYIVIILLPYFVCTLLCRSGSFLLVASVVPPRPHIIPNTHFLSTSFMILNEGNSNSAIITNRFPDEHLTVLS